MIGMTLDGMISLLNTTTSPVKLFFSREILPLRSVRSVLSSRDDFELHVDTPLLFSYTEVTNGIRSIYAPQSVILFCCSNYLNVKGVMHV